MGLITAIMLDQIGVWVPLDSSCLSAARWAPTLNLSVLLGEDDGSVIGTIQVQFRDGRLHEYPVFLNTFFELIGSSSPGGYYNEHIKGLT